MPLFLAHVAITAMLTGLIWFVQIVHYPLFARVDRLGFPAYHSGHTKRTFYVVAPMMFFELLTALWFVYQPPAGLPVATFWIGLGLLGGIWVSTFLVQVPDHDRLGKSKNRAVIRRMVQTNWVRTVLWTTRVVLLCYTLALR